MPGAPLSDDSSGKVTSSPTSSGAMPLASVMTVTVGAERSGEHVNGQAVGEDEPGDEQRDGRDEDGDAVAEGGAAVDGVEHDQCTCPSGAPAESRELRRVPAIRRSSLAVFDATPTGSPVNDPRIRGSPGSSLGGLGTVALA